MTDNSVEITNTIDALEINDTYKVGLDKRAWEAVKSKFDMGDNIIVIEDVKTKRTVEIWRMD